MENRAAPRNQAVLDFLKGGWYNESININSFWWFHLDELKLIKDDELKIVKLFDWIEHQMTRNEIRLP